MGQGKEETVELTAAKEKRALGSWQVLLDISSSICDMALLTHTRCFAWTRLSGHGHHSKQ